MTHIFPTVLSEMVLHVRHNVHPQTRIEVMNIVYSEFMLMDWPMKNRESYDLYTPIDGSLFDT